MKALIVDDSGTFRTLIRRVLESIPEVEVIGMVANGKSALEYVQNNQVDLVTLDMNMPVMNGIEFLKKLRDQNLVVRTIVFAAKTARSASETIEALSLGAFDFVVKPDGAGGSIGEAEDKISTQLLPKILPLVGRSNRLDKLEIAGVRKPVLGNEVKQVKPRRPISAQKYDVILVASSTGGPGALETLLSGLGGAPKVPILIAQHMPETFTKFLAKRLESCSGTICKEAEHGEEIKPGIIYVAPGNFHFKVGNRNGKKVALLDQAERLHSVRPAADHLFLTAAEAYGPSILGFILTGMGEDGAAGGRAVRNAGGIIVIQNKETSVVWGMPGFAHAMGEYDQIYSIQECRDVVARFSRKRDVA
jgi:two-component system chemotaxis response regulator CheB